MACWRSAGILDPADPEAHAERRGIVMRAIDKLDRLGEEGVRALLGAGRRDESGDFTAGRRARPTSRSAVILGFMAARRRRRRGDLRTRCASWSAARAIGLRGRRRSSRPSPSCSTRAARRGVIDPSRRPRPRLLHRPGLRGRAHLRDARRRRPAAAVRLGRRRRPLRRPRAGASPARRCRRPASRSASTGCSPRSARRARLAAREPGPVVVTVMDRDRMADYQAMAAELRAAGLRAEVFLGGGNLARQLKYADQRGSPVAVIEGGDERARGVVQLKDLALGARLAAEITTPRGLDGPAGAGRGAARPSWSRRCGRCWRGAPDGRRPRLPQGRADRRGASAGSRPRSRASSRSSARPGRCGSSRRRCSRPTWLLDLYGEDIRARAFVTADEGAEMMLRPDFTAADRAAAHGGRRRAGALRLLRPGLAAAGVRLRPAARVPAGGLRGLRGRRPGGAPTPRCSALVTQALGDAPVDLVTGDLGLAFAVIDALDTSAARRMALRRHVWRPARFRALLDRYGEGHAAAGARRAALFAAEAEGRTPALVAAAGAPVGLRTPEEVAARVTALAIEARTAPLDPGAVAARSRRCSASRAPRPRRLAELRALARGLRAARRRRRPAGGAARRRSRRAASSPARCGSRRASAARRSNTTTASSSARCRAAAPTCRRSPAAGATTR